jgi:hypothetical protein
MIKPKIQIIIDSNFHARSLFSNELSKELQYDFEVLYCISEKVDNKFIPSDIRTSRYQVPKRAEKLFILVLDASLIRNVRKSSSFRFRLRRYCFGDYSRFGLPSPTGMLRFLRSLLLAAPGIYWFLKHQYRLASKSLHALNLVSEEFGAEMIITWSSSIEPTTLFGILKSRELGAKSMTVFDNWDNLSSKAVLIERPDYMVCFGDQSKEFAQKIHGFNSDCCFALGSARFDSFIRVKSSTSKKILIAGSSIALEDSKIIEEISYCIDNLSKPNSSSEFKFYYRPHPNPQGASLDIDNWRNPKIELNPSNLKFRGDNWQSQNELAHELNQYQMIISAPTTLLIEALILGKSVIVPIFDVKGINTSIKTMINELEHLKPIKRLDGVRIVQTRDEMLYALQKILFETQIISKPNNLDWIITTTPGTFSSRFSSLLIKLLYETSVSTLDL